MRLLRPVWLSDVVGRSPNPQEKNASCAFGSFDFIRKNNCLIDAFALVRSISPTTSEDTDDVALSTFHVALALSC